MIKTKLVYIQNQSDKFSGHTLLASLWIIMHLWLDGEENINQEIVSIARYLR